MHFNPLFQATAYAKNNRLRRSYLALSQARGLGVHLLLSTQRMASAFSSASFSLRRKSYSISLGHNRQMTFLWGDGKTPHFFRGETLASILPWKAIMSTKYSRASPIALARKSHLPARSILRLAC